MATLTIDSANPELLITSATPERLIYVAGVTAEFEWDEVTFGGESITMGGDYVVW